MDTVEKLYQYILDDYHKYDVEFSGAHLDFEVSGLKGIELLELYARLQKTINGDDVVRSSKLLYLDEESGEIKEGNIEDLDNGSLNDIVNGNYEAFIRSLENTGVYRIMDMETDETDDSRIVGGIKLDLIF